jgi:hypothetical protein
VGAGYRVTDAFTVSAGYYNVDNEANSHNDQYTIQQFGIIPMHSMSALTSMGGSWLRTTRVLT